MGPRLHRTTSNLNKRRAVATMGPRGAPGRPRAMRNPLPKKSTALARRFPVGICRHCRHCRHCGHDAALKSHCVTTYTNTHRERPIAINFVVSRDTGASARRHHKTARGLWRHCTRGGLRQLLLNGRRMSRNYKESQEHTKHGQKTPQLSGRHHTSLSTCN